MNFRKRLALCYRILRAKPDELLAHTNRELLPDRGDKMQAMMNDDLRELVLVFGTQDHSGMSAAYCAAQLNLLLRYKPLRPLTGEDDEWVQLGYSHDMLAQNKRCSHVFKRRDGTAYDSQGRVFREPDGITYLGSNSRVDITFPYTPKVEYVDVDKEGNPL